VLTRPSFSTGYARNASESANPNLWKGLVGAWMPSFGVTGDTLKDVSGNGNDGTLTNMDAATDWVATSKGLALDFDNSVHKVSYQTNFQSEFQNSFTFSCLVKFNAADDRDVIFGNYNASFGWLNFERHTSNRLRHVYRNAPSAVVDDYSPVNSVSSGWNFVNFTRQRISITQSRLIYHVNGKEVRNALISYNDRTVPWPNFFLGADTRNIFTNLNGNIAFASIHDRALSPAEIKQLYLNPAAPFQKKTVVAGFVPKTFHKVAVLKKPEPSFVNGYARNASESARPHLWKGLVGAWMPMMGQGGWNLQDISGRSNDADLYGRITPGKVSAIDGVRAVNLDSGTDFYKVDKVTDFSPAKVTYSVWMIPTLTGTTHYVGGVWRQGRRSWMLKASSGIAQWFTSTNGSSFSSTNCTTSYVNNKLINYTGTYDGLKSRIYVNGNLEAETSVSGDLFDSQTEFSMGDILFYGPSSPFGGSWNGYIAGQMIHNRALSPSEIKELFIKPLAPFERKSTAVGAPAPPPPPVTNYKAVKVTKSHIKPSFKTGYARNASESANPNLWKGLVGAWMPSFGVTGNTLKDVSGNGNDGTLTNMDAASDWVATSKGLALDFEVNDRVIVPHNSQVDVKKQLTVTVLCKPSVNRNSWTALAYKNVLQKNGSYHIGIDPSNNLAGGVKDGNWRTVQTSASVTAGSWHYVAMTIDENLQEITFYKNGKVVYQSAWTWVMSGNNYPLTIASNGGVEYFYGQIAFVSLHNRALSPAEIKQLYLNPTAPFKMKDTFVAYKDPLPPVRGLFRLP
jgi:hypothetical protein